MFLKCVGKLKRALPETLVGHALACHLFSVSYDA
jgi:hypothetical protein